ncbi:exodeoxyribonuclease VII small subunit [Nitrosomonas communis]|uniref:Exodeoxyribonuclease 7 small subunit n=2 Tax=Nitrosomonadaceae TaxID=206379 RepID=A0A0F7KKZ2_9PROT|nr:exodeoxyribonuclease [Nitrosomonas communis]TYP87381.1 exodeoxyribonuclease VII small subunit [Nitrosomonas communis]SDW53836.1 exodeoxyribonuclease VII small subunit [Nitrosomonas communis]
MTASPPQPDSFEAASTELEAIVVAMEAGKMTLEASLSAYKRGVELLHYCQTTLQNAQQQIRVLEADMLKDFSTSGIDER